MKCPVAGYPIEEIKWERANRELPDDLRQKVLPDGTLVITSVQKKGDAGVYTCSARNKQGHSARRSGDVAVIGKAFRSCRYSTIVAGVSICRGDNDTNLDHNHYLVAKTKTKPNVNFEKLLLRSVTVIRTMKSRKRTK